MEGIIQTQNIERIEYTCPNCGTESLQVPKGCYTCAMCGSKSCEY